MYAQAWRIFWDNIVLVGTIALASAIFEMVTRLGGVPLSMTAMFIEVLLWAYLAMVAHNILLARARQRPAPFLHHDIYCRFAIHAVGLMLLCVLAIVPLWIAASLRGAFGEVLSPLGTGALMLAALICALMIPLSIFALFGTILPATIDRANLAFERAYDRGRATFWRTAKRLVLGPGLVLIAQGIFSMAMTAGLGIGGGSSRFFWLDAMAARLIEGGFFAYAVVLTAVILSMAYLEARKKQRSDDPASLANGNALAASGASLS